MRATSAFVPTHANSRCDEPSFVRQVRNARKTANQPTHASNGKNIRQRRQNADVARKNDGAEKLQWVPDTNDFGGCQTLGEGAVIAYSAFLRVCIFARFVRREFFSTVKNACSTCER